MHKLHKYANIHAWKCRFKNYILIIIYILFIYCLFSTIVACVFDYNAQKYGKLHNRLDKKIVLV